MVWVFLVLLMFVSGCQVGPPYEAPSPYTPENWKHTQTEDAVVECVGYWWEIFQDETLNSLEILALQYNNDLYAALDRVAQARAMAGVARADLYPQLTLNPSYSNQDVLTKIFKVDPAITTVPFLREHQLTYMLPLNLSYELDLWGLLRNYYKAAIFNAQAQDQAFQTTLLILSADLADSYFRLRTFDAEIELYRTTIKTRKKALEITTARYEGKLADYADVSRAALELTNVEADYYEAVRQREIEEDRIAVLIGMPASDFCLEHQPLVAGPPGIPAGLPSDILLKRPDIAEAERRMAAEHALIRVAYASFFPSISITGALGFSSPDLGHFLKWKSRFWAIGADALQTVFDAGRKFSELDLAWARFNEADRTYQQQVLVAFQEVEDALTSIENLYKESEKLTLSVQSAKKTFQIFKDRYLQGVTFYLEVVDSERDELNAERRLIAVQGMRYTATIQLIKALGGSWL